MNAEQAAVSSDTGAQYHLENRVIDLSLQQGRPTPSISRRLAIKMSLASLAALALGSGLTPNARAQDISVDTPSDSGSSSTAPVLPAGESGESVIMNTASAVIVYRQDYVATFGTPLQNRAIANLEGPGLRSYHSPNGYTIIRPKGGEEGEEGEEPEHTRAEIFFKKDTINNGFTTTRASLETPGNWGIFLCRQEDGRALNFYIRTGEEGRLWAAAYSDDTEPFTGWRPSEAIRPGAEENTLKMISNNREMAFIINDSHVLTYHNERLGPGIAGYSVGAPGKLRDIVAVIKYCEIGRL